MASQIKRQKQVNDTRQLLCRKNTIHTVLKTQIKFYISNTKLHNKYETVNKSKENISSLVLKLKEEW